MFQHIFPFMSLFCVVFASLSVHGFLGVAQAAPKKRVAIYQSGEFWEFTEAEKILKSLFTKEGLMQFIEFPDNLRFSPGAQAPEEAQHAVARQLMQDPSIDLIISLGTRASHYLLHANNGRTPVVCIQVTNPPASGLVDKGTGKPAAPNFFVPYDPSAHVEMFRLFHSSIPFKKLGIMQTEADKELSFIQVDDIREVARERGFALVEYTAIDKQQSPESCEKAIHSLLDQGIDAFYVAPMNCLDLGSESQKNLYKLLHDRGIRTFASSNYYSQEVQAGVLLGFIIQNIEDMGALVLRHLVTALQLPVYVPQEKTTPNLSRIVLNLDTALRSNIPVSLVLLVTADTIYETNFAPLTSLEDLQRTASDSKARTN